MGASERRQRHTLYLVVVGVLLGALIDFNAAGLALVVPTTVGVLGLIALGRALAARDATAAETRTVVRWSLVALFAHLAFGLVVTNSARAVYYLGGDAGTYHTYATWITEFGTKSLTHPLQSGKEGFYLMLVGLFKVFGPHDNAGLAVNATLSAAMVPLVCDITRRLFGPAAARRVPPIVVLFPSIFLFTSQLLKEAAILFLLSVAACAAVRMAERMTLASVGVLAGAIALLLTFRGPIALVGGAGLVGGVALAKREVLGGLTAGLSALAVAAVLVLVVGIGYSGVRATLQASSLAESNKVRSGLAQGSNTGFGSEIDTSTPRRAISYLPIGLTRFAVGPFPWELRSLHALPALIDVVVLWALVPAAFRGFRRSFASLGRRVAVLILPSSVMAVVLALSVGNIGILVRERMQAFILVIPFIALGLSLRGAPRPEPEPEADRRQALSV